MYTPINTPIFGSVAPVAAVDLTLNTFLGVSWHVLLPYTIFGAALMIYSQTMLLRGQRHLKRTEDAAAKSSDL